MTKLSNHLLVMLTSVAISCTAFASTDAKTSQPTTISPASTYLNEAYQLVDQMTLAQQIGQMTLVKFTMLENKNGKADYRNISNYHLGALLVGGGEVPGPNNTFIAGMNNPKDYLSSTLKNWVAITNKAKANLPIVQVGKQQVRIPLLFGIDAVHGAQTILGNTTFPQNIALSMTHDPALIEQVEHWTAKDLLAAGFNWAYAPTVAVSHNPDWGRFMETLGDQPQWIIQYAQAMTKGLQTINPSSHQYVLATVKHFLGDGATFNGIDEGNDHVIGKQGMVNFLKANRLGYLGGINNAHGGSIMVSYSAINDLPMSFNKRLLSELRQGNLLGQPFQGLIVSDYGAVDKASSQGLPATTIKTPYPQALAKAVNAGIDLFMLTSTSQAYQSKVESQRVAKFQTILTDLVKSGAISRQRIRSAAAHVIAAKIAMGLLSYNPVTKQWTTHQPALTYIPKTQANAAETQVALRAAEESFVLLKNQHQLLPLQANHLQYIVLTGEQIIKVLNDNNQRVATLFTNYNNIGAENGGWTVAWQGIEGNTFWRKQNKINSGATSILSGIKQLAPNAMIIYPHYTSYTNQQTIQTERQAFLSQLKNKYPKMNAHNTVVIDTLAALPAAEFMGDINNPYCVDNHTYTNGCLYNLHLNPYTPEQQPKTLALDYSHFDQQVMAAVKIHGNIPVVTVLLSGRPRIITAGSNPFTTSQAFIAAWLPGTSGGQAIANSLFGKYRFCNGKTCTTNSPNTLSVPWVRNMQQLKNYPVYTKHTKGIALYKQPLFPIGYGLSD